MPYDSASRAVVERYHDGTKHAFHAFARSLGYLDWASQPRPFRTFDGAARFPLHPTPSLPAGGYAPARRTYSQLFASTPPEAPLTAAAIGDLLRHALGLSAWKQIASTRWALRVNPSSGNLHPTEAYVIAGPVDGFLPTPGVYHYASDQHALEVRCAFDDASWRAARPGHKGILVALTSIHWRESWKYGERAFRYCQHDLGHAIAALSIASALLGWRAVLLPNWSHRAIGSLVGLDRDEDFIDAEREDAGCLVAIEVSNASHAARPFDAAPLLEGVRAGRWSGRASQLSEDHVQWTFIDEVARATEDPGASPANETADANVAVVPESSTPGIQSDADARAIILQRRSAVAFDGQSRIARDTFMAMLARVLPRSKVPWNSLWWTPRIHLAIFVHRVDDLEPGLYLLPRAPQMLRRLKAACVRDFLWEPADDRLPLVCLSRGDARSLAARLGCDQAIAADGFFSLGMVADFSASLDEYGASFYRNLFWESGAVGQVLYLDAEAAGARATGIGCFYDNPVHDVLGLEGHAYQSLYHFSMGVPVEDSRLTTAPGYGWEAQLR